MIEFFRTPGGKIVGSILLVVAVGAAIYSAMSLFGSGPAGQAAQQVFVDSSTGQSFKHTLTDGEIVPIKAPTGGMTGYPAELCYWTADGQPKSTPDYVLLKEAQGLPGPTFCPVCHRLVVHHNPTPASGAKCPPTEAEYEARHGG